MRVGDRVGGGLGVGMRGKGVGTRIRAGVVKIKVITIIDYDCNVLELNIRNTISYEILKNMKIGPDKIEKIN